MGKKDVKIVSDIILGEVSGFSRNGSLIFAQPLSDCLRGFFINSTRPGRFYLHVFFQPLFVPCDIINLNAGFRLRDGQGRELGYTDSPLLASDIARAVAKDALPFLEITSDTSNKRAIIDWATGWWAKGQSLAMHAEAVASCHASLGEIDKAEPLWEGILQWLRPDIPWQVDKQKIILEIRTAFREGIDVGNAKLDKWTEQTKVKLGIS
jgi:hypothetical protein